MASVPESLPRRKWLLHSLNATIAATVAAFLYPITRFLAPRAATTSGAPEATAPFRVNELPNAVGNPFDFGGKPCVVVLTSDGVRRRAKGLPLRPGEDVKAFNAICTHMDCTVQYRADQGDIFCNCHDGVYDLNGRNVSGPPPRPLEEYKVSFRGDTPGQEEIIVSRST
jgi:Rieske Fe-S protein